MDKQTVLDSRLIEKFESHRDFTKLFLDAFVLVNQNQVILKFNPIFCQIIEQKSTDVREIGSLDKIISTESSEFGTEAITKLLNSKTPMRIDNIKAVNKLKNKNLVLIMSSYPYLDSDGQHLGACILMRDITAESNLREQYNDKALESITDPLTGLYTRRYFESQIDGELARCQLANLLPSVGLIMLDLDHFKSVNDTHGHQAGDYVLSETAKILKAITRRRDVLCRYGGEEMIVLIFDADEKSAYKVAEKYRSSVEKHEYIYLGKKIPLTTSIGVTLFKSKVEKIEDTKEKALKRADDCLYRAKALGRNIVILDYDGTQQTIEDYVKSH